MSNPFENSPHQPPKPAVEKSLPQEPVKPETAVVPEESPAETLTDAEVLRNYTVPVPHTPEGMAAAKKRYDADWVEPETIEQSPEEGETKEDVEKLRKVVELMDDFELKYPLTELHAITSIPLAELIEHPVRKPANTALVHIRKAMALLGSNTGASEIDARYLRLSQAVGVYNSLSKTVDHDRG